MNAHKRTKTLHNLIKLTDALRKSPDESLNESLASEIYDLVVSLNNGVFVLCRKLHEANADPTVIAALLFNNADELTCAVVNELLSVAEQLKDLSLVDFTRSAMIHPLVISGIHVDSSYIARFGDSKLGHAAESAIEKRLIAITNAALKNTSK